MSLARYKAKRDFTRTREPAGKVTRTRAAKPKFVIQKHAATRLHYDFRLEIEGVLKSWAVPKGVPTELGEKRLAMQVEDHPIEYGRFEGTIPKGNYGAGTVMLWDTGTFDVIQGEAAASLRKGKLELLLKGKKLKGEWTLVRMRAWEGREENAWLLIKTGEAMRPISARVDDTSVRTGKTMNQIASRSRKVWKSSRSSHSSSTTSAFKQKIRKAIARKRRAH